MKLQELRELSNPTVTITVQSAEEEFIDYYVKANKHLKITPTKGNQDRLFNLEVTGPRDRIIAFLMHDMGFKNEDRVVMKYPALRRGVKESQLAEARDPKKTYHVKEVKGKIDAITVKLEGHESAIYTKMARRYKEINTELKKLSDERDEMNEKIKKDILENFFDAEDALYTRIVETVSLTAQIAKTPVAKPKIDNDAVVTALLDLMPELKAKIIELQKVHTSLPTPRAPALTTKTNEGIGDVWAAFKSKTAELLKSITAWGKSYDKKLATIKEMLKPTHQVAESGFGFRLGSKQHADLAASLQRRNKFPIKVKIFVRKLKDSGVPQATVDAVIDALDGHDGDKVLSREDIEQLCAIADVDLADVLGSTGLDERVKTH